MADVVLAGPLSVAVDALRTLVANVAYFQTWTGTASAAQALGRVFAGEVGYPIKSVSVASGVITVKTMEPHGLLVSDTFPITIEGASIGDQASVEIDGQHFITAVTATSFTCDTSLANAAEFNPDGAMVLPCARPMVTIGEGDDGLRSEVIGTGGAAIYAGSIDLLMEADVSSQYAQDARNALYEARNAFGLMIEGLQETQGTGDLMCLNRIEPVQGPEFTSKPGQDDNTIRFERWRAVVRVHWGLEG